MKIEILYPPRKIKTQGIEKEYCLDHCANISLEPDELITLVTPSGTEFDITRKPWGYYATPSLNCRLKKFNLRPVLVKNSIGHYFVWLVEKGKEDEFYCYLNSEKHQIILWLDGDCIESFEKK